MKASSKIKIKDIEIELYHLLPLLFIAAIVPLIVYLKVKPLTGASYLFWTGQQTNNDFFSYYKAIWLIIATAISFVIYLYKLIQTNYRMFCKELIPYYAAVGVYLVFIIASTALSKYHDLAVWGFPDRYEGAFVLTSYIFIFFFATNFARTEKTVKILLGTLLAGAFVMGIIGIFQYSGHDVLQSSFGKSLTMPKKFEQYANQLRFAFGEHTVYGTLYHRDYAGSYMAMFFPLSLSLFALVKDLRLKIAMGLFTLLMGVDWLGTNSRAGLVGGVLALIFFIIVINKLIRKHWKLYVGGVIILIAIAVGLNQISHGYLSTRVNSLIADAKSLVSSSSDNVPLEDKIPLKDIKFAGDTATLITTDSTLSFATVDHQPVFKDEKGNIIESSYNKKDGKVILADPRYKSYDLTYGKMGDKDVVKLVKKPLDLLFENKQDNTWNLIDAKGQEFSLGPVESWGFQGKELLGSARGYIWSRSLPLLKNTVVLGFGPDTYPAYFPQNDLKGKLYAYGNNLELVDKPHNLYLQIALNTGIISLLAVVVLFGLYIVKSIRIYFNNDFSTFYSRVGVSIFVSIIGYLGAAFFNDSVVSVAPIFWLLLGLGVSVNHLYVKTRAIDKKPDSANENI